MNGPKYEVVAAGFNKMLMNWRGCHHVRVLQQLGKKLPFGIVQNHFQPLRESG